MSKPKNKHLLIASNELKKADEIIKKLEALVIQRGGKVMLDLRKTQRATVLGIVYPSVGGGAHE